MPGKNFDITEALKQAKLHDENNMEFSALLLWQKIVEAEPTEYRKFRYADALRLCGHLLRAEKTFLDIDVQNIPAASQYFYHLYFGILYKDMGNFKQAKEQFLACMAFDNCDTVPYIFIATLLKPDRDNAEAIYYLRLGLEKEGDHDEVCYNLSRRLAIKGDMEAALEAINKCLSFNAGYPGAANFKEDIVTWFSLKQML
jgi:tetratricopeptide (TPR) repeat protein